MACELQALIDKLKSLVEQLDVEDLKQKISEIQNAANNSKNCKNNNKNNKNSNNNNSIQCRKMVSCCPSMQLPTKQGNPHIFPPCCCPYYQIWLRQTYPGLFENEDEEDEDSDDSDSDKEDEGNFYNNYNKSYKPQPKEEMAKKHNKIWLDKIYGFMNNANAMTLDGRMPFNPETIYEKLNKSKGQLMTMSPCDEKRTKLLVHMPTCTPSVKSNGLKC